MTKTQMTSIRLSTHQKALLRELKRRDPRLTLAAIVDTALQHWARKHGLVDAVTVDTDHVDTAQVPSVADIDEVDRRIDREWSEALNASMQRSEDEQRRFAEETERKLKEALGDLLT